MRRIATTVAGFFLAAIIVISILPSGSSQARWSDSTTLTRAEFTTTTSADQPPIEEPPAEETPTDPTPPVISPGDGSNSDPGFTITAGDEDIVFDLATLKRGAVKHGSGPDSLPNHVEITVWIAPDRGPDTCTAIRTGSAEGAVQVSNAIRHNELNGGKKYTFKPSTVNITAGETYVVCPIVTIDGGDDFSKFPGSSFELIFEYSFASDSDPINGRVTTTFEVDNNSRRTSEAPQAFTLTEEPAARDDSENQNTTEDREDSANQNDSEATEESVNSSSDGAEFADEKDLDPLTSETDSEWATGDGETP